ncbi:unnamed protein product, partial [Brassica rapa subsp. trilocularis]
SGEWKVTNAFDSTLVLINPDIKEAKALRQKFQGDATTVEMCQHINEKIVIHEKRQKWSQYPFRTIQEMKYCDKVEIQAMLPPEIVEIVGKSYGFGISVDENNNSSGLEKIEAMKVWGLKDILWKRTKSLHQNSTTSRKKQCTNVFKINESG